MDEELTQLVWRRARHRCEYRQPHSDSSRVPFEIDHNHRQEAGRPGRLYSSAPLTPVPTPLP